MAASGPWLFGAYSLADVFFAPVAARIATYGLPVGAEAMAYVAAHLADPAFLAWRAEGLADPFVQPRYDLDLPERAWPGPAGLRRQRRRAGSRASIQPTMSASTSSLPRSFRRSW